MKILICGGRTFSDHEFLYRTMNWLVGHHTPSWAVDVIHGGATGADSVAHGWAYSRSFNVRVFHAAWDTHGRAAGPIRNARMLSEGKPQLVVAFDGGTGTANMVKIAKRAGVKVFEPTRDMVLPIEVVRVMEELKLGPEEVAFAARTLWELNDG